MPGKRKKPNGRGNRRPDVDEPEVSNSDATSKLRKASNTKQSNKRPKVFTLTEAFTNFDDLEDDIDDLDLLNTAKSIWRTLNKQAVIAEVVSHSPSKRKQALTAKLDEVRRLAAKTPSSQNQHQSFTPQNPPSSPADPVIPRPAISPLLSPEQGRLSASPFSLPTRSSTPPPNSTFPPPSDSQLSRPSTSGIRSDSIGVGIGDEESDEEDYGNRGSGIISAGSLKKSIMGRAAEENMVSGRVRFTMKGKTPEEKAKWSLTHNVVKLEFIQTGPSPPAEERDNRLTDDEELQQLIVQRYRDIFGEEAPDVNNYGIVGAKQSIWGFTGRIHKFIVIWRGLESYNLPSMKNLEARKVLCEKLTEKSYPFVWATLTPRNKGRFLHPAIIAGLKRVFFGSKRGLGNLAPMAGMTALRDNLTAEAVAWICIGILWGLENACTKNNYKDSIFSPSGYRGRWLLFVRDIKKQPKVLELLREQVVEKKDREMDEDLEDAGVPLEEFSDESIEA